MKHVAPSVSCTVCPYFPAERKYKDGRYHLYDTRVLHSLFYFDCTAQRVSSTVVYGGSLTHHVLRTQRSTALLSVCCSAYVCAYKRKTLDSTGSAPIEQHLQHSEVGDNSAV